MKPGVRVLDDAPGHELSTEVLARVAERHAQRLILVSFEPKPSRSRAFDWTACEADHEIGKPAGHGATAELALLELLEILALTEEIDALGAFIEQRGVADRILKLGDLLPKAAAADPDPWTAEDSQRASDAWAAEIEAQHKANNPELFTMTHEELNALPDVTPGADARDIEINGKTVTIPSVASGGPQLERRIGDGMFEDSARDEWVTGWLDGVRVRRRVTGQFFHPVR